MAVPIDPDGNVCADGDRLFAAGDAGGDFQAGGARDRPRRHRRPQAPRPDRRRDPRPAARRAVRLCHDEEIPRGVRVASLRDLPDLERLKAEGLHAEQGGARPTSMARSGLVMLRTKSPCSKMLTIRPSREQPQANLPRLGSRIRIVLRTRVLCTRHVQPILKACTPACANNSYSVAIFVRVPRCAQ